MNKSLIKYTVLGVSAFITTLALNTNVEAATVHGEKPIAGITVSLDKYYQTTNTTTDGLALASSDFLTKEAKRIAEEAELEQYKSIGIANVEKYLNIRRDPSEAGEVIGKLPTNGGCYIDSIDENGWAQVRSGDITGYVLSTYLVMGDEVPALAKQVGKYVAEVLDDGVRIRSDKNTECDVLASVGRGEDLDVIDDSDPEWVQVSVDNVEGYIYRQYVSVSYQLSKAIAYSDDSTAVAASASAKSTSSSSTQSSVRSQMVAYAKQFLGNRYVYGGTSLTNGTDCSGFTMRIYQKFGYSISRTSRSQATQGTAISVSQVKPGDLLFYNSGGAINHVAMYIGNGQIIHASNPKTGIKISNASYRQPCKAVRFIND